MCRVTTLQLTMTRTVVLLKLVPLSLFFCHGSKGMDFWISWDDGLAGRSAEGQRSFFKSNIEGSLISLFKWCSCL